MLISRSPIFKYCGQRKGYLPTRVSYKLNLKGPSVNVEHRLLHIAGRGPHRVPEPAGLRVRHGAGRRRRIQVPQKTGYLYQEGGIGSPDGHCRAFDAGRRARLFGSGVGMVLVEAAGGRARGWRLDQGGDPRLGVNNDGSLKVGYTAPSIDGPGRGDCQAQAVAGVEPETITYVETHGTGNSRWAIPLKSRPDAAYSAPGPRTRGSAPSAR